MSLVEERDEVVGRVDTLEQLSTFLRRISSGFSACALSGPAGIGKTTVWRRGVALARAAGCTVLSTRPSGAEARLSYSALSDLLSEIEPRRFDRLPAVQRCALDVALLRSGPADSAVDARAVATGLLSLLRGLAGAAPVLVAIDDAQWLDEATSAALGYALRRLEDEPVGVLASVRVDDLPPNTFIDAIPSDRRIEIVLAPLDLFAIHQILLHQLGRVPARSTLVKIVAASGGNPFHAIEIARELFRAGDPASPDPLPVSPDVQALVRARLERLPQPTVEALLAAASLTAPHAMLVDVEALAAAEEAGIVGIASDGRIRFSHPLFAAAVYESASTFRRRAVHRELAARVADLEERARHLALGSEQGDPEACRQLETAATAAGARGAPGAAAELIELALRLAPAREDAKRAERLLLAARFHFEAGDLARAEATAGEVARGVSSGRLRAQALRILGQLHSRRSGFGKALEVALAALAAADGDKALAAEVQMDLVYYYTMLGDFARAEDWAREAVDSATKADLAPLLASVLAAQAVIGFMAGRGFNDANVCRALSLDDPTYDTPLVLRPHFAYASLLLWMGRLDEALDIMHTLRIDSLERGRENDVPFMFLYLVWANVWRGDIAEAARLASDARRSAALLADTEAEALSLSAAALAHAYDGQAELARTEATRAIALFEQLRSGPGTIWGRWALGLLELSRGAPADAHAALAPLTPMVEALGPIDPVLVMFLPDEIEALIELGDTTRADALLAGFAARARAVDRQWALAAADRCRGLLSAARGDFDAALAKLDEALARYAALPLPLERARTLLALGRLHRRRRQKRLARLALEEALAAFERSGAPLWAAQTRAELARVRARQSPHGLTATEERIARLAAEGLTNRAIAERVFVSINTVEANLTRVYRKLGISSRVQLARALGGRAAKRSS